MPARCCLSPRWHLSRLTYSDGLHRTRKGLTLATRDVGSVLLVPTRPVITEESRFRAVVVVQSVSSLQTTQKPGGGYRDLENRRFWAENEIPVVPTGSNTTETGLASLRRNTSHGRNAIHSARTRRCLHEGSAKPQAAPNRHRKRSSSQHKPRLCPRKEIPVPPSPACQYTERLGIRA